MFVNSVEIMSYSVVECSDKGRVTVILNKEDYTKKCNDHLDSGPYIKLQRDPTEKIKREARTKLAILRDNGTIDQSLYFKLKPTDSQAPRFHSSTSG